MAGGRPGSRRLRDATASVRTRLMATLALLVFGTAAVGGAAVAALMALERGYDAFADERLPALASTTRTVQLAQDSLGLLVLLSGAASQTERRQRRAEIDARLDQAEARLGELAQAGAAGAEADAIAERLARLRAAVGEMDGAVRARIDADDDAGRVHRQLPGLSQRMRAIHGNLAGRFAEPPDGAPPDAARIAAAGRWLASGTQALSAAAGAATIDSAAFLEAQQREFGAHLEAMVREAEGLPGAARSLTDRIRVALEDVGTGPQNVFDARRRQLAERDAALDALRRADAAAGAFLAASAAAYARASRQAEDESRSVGRAADAAAAAGLAVLAAVLAIGAAAALFVERGVLRRLGALRRAMQVHAAGGDAVIDTAGRDEIAEMAVALRHMVDELAHRQRLAEAARDSAETAYAELRAAQRDLIEMEKMSSLGQLVAGVAHEINTPVGVALTASTALGDQAAELGRSLEAGRITRAALNDFVAQAVQATRIVQLNLERAGRLVQSFKRVSVDRSTSERRRFRLDQYLGDIALSLQPEFARTPHRLVVDAEPGIEMESLPGELAQVVTNLVMNAVMHAFPCGKAGTVSVSARRGEEGRVVVEVADDGAGMTEEVAARALEPFFTTRRNAGGTGLGLHIAYNIVAHALGGRLSLATALGEGTRVRLDLPEKA